MNDRTVAPFAVLLTVATLLAGAGCAPPIERTLVLPPPPPPPPVALPAPVVDTTAPPRPTALVAGEQRALALQHQGDLAAALIQWRILRTLSPDDPEIQRQLAATRALIRHRVETNLAAGAAAEQAGDTAAARGAYLQALALDPENRVALARLRDLETTVLYAAQYARLDKLRARRARAVARKQGGRTAPAREADDGNGNGQERDYRNLGIALFEAGDYEASILELRKYLGSFPEDDRARDILRKAEEGARQSTARTGARRVQRPPPAAATATKSDSRLKTGASPGAPATSVPPPPKVSAADEKAAQELYEQGLRASRQNIAEAIRLWEQSLQKNPRHVQAGLRLEQAHKIQQRLDAIDRR